MKRAGPFLSGALPAMLLGGCSLAPPNTLPDAPVPQTWPTGDAYLAQSEAALPSVSYRDVFRDQRLLTLIDLAMAENRDLRIAAANVAAARAQVRVTRSAQFPELGLTGSATYSQQPSGNPAVGSRDGAAYALQGGVSSFEVDLFGRLASATQAQRERALATEAAARTIRIALIADLAQAWAAYGADRDLLNIAQATAQNAERSVGLTQARLKGGVAPRTDLRQAEQILSTAQGDVAAQTAALAQDENLIRLLIGTDFDKALLPASMAEVVTGVQPLPTGVSSQVLLRRPDVVEAEYTLRAANADIGVARAQLFPAISLTGLLGMATNALSSLFTSNALQYSIGGDVRYSIFNAGGRLANVDVSEAQRDAALSSYERAIQIAFREVADALADQGTLGERLRAASVNASAAADTAKLTDARYRYGVDSYLSSLDAQRSLYAARQSEVAVQLALAANRITLYRVLGGDQAVANATP